MLNEMESKTAEEATVRFLGDYGQKKGYLSFPIFPSKLQNQT